MLYFSNRLRPKKLKQANILVGIALDGLLPIGLIRPDEKLKQVYVAVGINLIFERQVPASQPQLRVMGQQSGLNYSYHNNGGPNLEQFRIGYQEGRAGGGLSFRIYRRVNGFDQRGRLRYRPTGGRLGAGGHSQQKQGHQANYQRRIKFSALEGRGIIALAEENRTQPVEPFGYAASWAGLLNW